MPRDFQAGMEKKKKSVLVLGAQNLEGLITRGRK